MSRILITGTDTGVGKTLVSAAILKSCIEKGIEVGALKPVETGCELVDGELVASDVECLHSALSGSLSREELIIEKFVSPVAPKVAAEYENRAIDWASLVSVARARADKYQRFLVEGAGGLLVPITGAKTYADLALECDLSVVIVFGSKLGAINHAALTFEVLRARGIKTLGYVFNSLAPNNTEMQGIESAENSNRALIAEVAAQYEIEELAYFPYSGEQVRLEDLPKVAEQVNFDKLMERLEWT